MSTATLSPAALASKVASVIIQPLVILLVGIAVLVFVWGVIEFLIDLNSGAEIQKGKDHMIWGVVGIFVMVSAVAIFQIIQNTINSF